MMAQVASLISSQAHRNRLCNKQQAGQVAKEAVSGGEDAGPAC